MNNKLKQVCEYSKKEMDGDGTGHGFDHIQRVVKNADEILTSEPADREITLSATYLHDIADDKVCSDPETKKAEINDKLNEIGFSKSQVEAIFAIINHMSFSDNLEKKNKLSLEGEIVQDADRLDALGAIGIARAFQYGGAKHRTLYDPKIKPREINNKADYRDSKNGTTINHFYEKLFKIPADLNTIEAKRIGKQRKEFMEKFVDEFKNEC